MRLILCFCLLASLGAAQQPFLGHAIQFTPDESPGRHFDTAKYRGSLIEKYTPRFRNGEDLNDFVNTLVNGKKYYLSSNAEYERWDSAAAYLTKIISTLQFSAPLTFTPNVRVIRDPSVNAFAFEDGTIYVNVGLLSAFHTEAEIAAVLGHEVGHVIKDHVYENYKTQRSYFRAINSRWGLTHSYPIIGSLVTSAVHSNRLISNEEESDEISMNALRTPGYNGAALSGIFSRFMRLEKKEEATKSHRKSVSLLYLKTHPNPERRLRNAAEALAYTGKNFIVDSAYFMRLKKQCTDETINLLFENLDFNECIERAFVQHLKQPADPFYLFYLTECTRRLLEIDKTFGEEDFISCFYNKKFCFKQPEKPKPFAMAKGAVKPYEKAFLNSVFYALEGPLLETDSADFAAIKQSPLVKSDTLPFITYSDALIYFKNRNAALMAPLNNVFFTGPVDPESLSEQEARFNQLPGIVKTYSTEPTDNKVLWRIFNVTHVHRNFGLFEDDVKMINSTYHDIYSKLKDLDTSHYLSTGGDLAFNDRNSLDDYLNIIYPLFKDQDIKNLTLRQSMNGAASNPELATERETIDVPISLIMPELTATLKKHHYKGIVFSSVYISEEKTKGMLGYENVTQQWKVKHFYLDAKTGKTTLLKTVLVNSEGSLQGFISAPTREDTFRHYYESVLSASR